MGASRRPTPKKFMACKICITFVEKLGFQWGEGALVFGSVVLGIHLVNEGDDMFALAFIH